MNDQTGFTKFVNQTQMASLGTLISQVLWCFGSIVLTVADAWLLTRKATEILYSRAVDPLAASASVSVFLAHNTAAEMMRQVGLYLAGLLIFGWTGKSVAGFFSNKNVRETSREYVEAKARGEAQTAEHRTLPAVQAHTVQKVEVRTERAEPAEPEHQWADGDPKAGIL
jgi:hypothetical protein